MGRPCSVCQHPQSFEINEALIIEGRSNRSLAKQYGLDHNAVQRHRQHIPGLLLKARNAMQIREAEALVELLERQIGDMEDAKGSARDEGDYRAIVNAASNIVSAVEPLGKALNAYYSQQAASHELISPEAADAIYEALEPYPEVYRRVAEALEALRNRRALEAGTG